MSTASETCRITEDGEACEKSAGPSGLCCMHATRIKRHGDPLAVTHQRDRDLPRGEDHPCWTGADATYNAAHLRIRAHLGKAADHPCIDCGGSAQQWSYDHMDPDESVSDDGRAYSLDPAHYAPRCISCHKTYDYGVLRRKGRLGTALRCGKPMMTHRSSDRLSEAVANPLCGRPAGHNGPCRSGESYGRTLEKNRGAA